MIEPTWWSRVLFFAIDMIIRFEAKESLGWAGFEDISESEYQERAIKNIRERHYVDAANLCLLAELVADKEEKLEDADGQA